MKSTSKVTEESFDKLFIRYARQMSKQCHLPKEVENRLLREVSKKILLNRTVRGALCLKKTSWP